MRTNIIIDDLLMKEALSTTGYKTKKETVAAGLRLLITMKKQSDVRKYRGMLKWEGDLDAMRTDI
jgi:Arc/MetJ family transcription regulator